MFICKNCNEEIREEEFIRKSECIGEAWGQPAYEESCYCPHCGGDEFEELIGSNLKIYENKKYGNTETSTTDIICPCCGYSEKIEIDMYYGEDFPRIYEAGTEVLTCPECGNEFRLSKEMEWKYTTEVIDNGDN